MQRFALFVDGPNLFGSMKGLNLEIESYDEFYGDLYLAAVAYWRSVTKTPESVPTQLRRVYWYVVGSMDEWDLSEPRAQVPLRKALEAEVETWNALCSETARQNPSLSISAIADRAWSTRFADIKAWYESKLSLLDRMRGFYQAVRSRTDLIDVIEAGHWRVNFTHKTLDEKGLDTTLAVDMIAQVMNYDVAVVITGDADSIPSIRHLKQQDKQVCVVKFLSTEAGLRNHQFSNRLQMHADFVLSVSESTLRTKTYIRCS